MLCSVLVYLLVVSPLCAKRTSGGSSVGRGQGVHYPPSTGLSGNTNYKTGHTYPHSTGLSGDYGTNQRNTYNSYGSSHNPKPQVHHHYHYNPPQHISYGAATHPVYHGTPPVYVYEYRNSGSRYDSLLTGLALYNLGRMSASHNHGQYYSGNEYRSPPGETCKMRIERNRVEYEETRIDCRLISSFILEAPKENNPVVIQTVTTTNVTKETSENGTSTMTTVKNTTVVADALSVKGPSVQISPEMQCFVIRHSRYGTDLKRKVDCGLLQEYAIRSMRAGCNKLIPNLTIIFVLIYVIKICRHFSS